MGEAVFAIVLCTVTSKAGNVKSGPVQFSFRKASSQFPIVKKRLQANIFLYLGLDLRSYKSWQNRIRLKEVPMYTCPECGANEVRISRWVPIIEYWTGDDVENEEDFTYERGPQNISIECMDCGFEGNDATLDDWLEEC